MKQFRWGIVGPGKIACKFARAVNNLPETTLAAVASRDEERGRAFAEEYGIPQVYSSYEAMAAADTVDAVYIATPHPFHLPCALLYLKAGKHVLCEKPLCVNAAEAKALKACAEENGVFLMEAMWTRFLPAVQEAKRLAEEGLIGEIKGMRADFCYRLTPEQEPKIFRNDMAGGSLLDVGVYCLHFADLFLGAPKRTEAVSQLEYGVDSHTVLTLQYENGAIASLSSATTLRKPADGYLFGTKGYLYFPQFYGAKGFTLCTKTEEKHYSFPPIGEGFEEEILEVCRCIEAGRNESDILPLSKTIEILEQMDEIRAQVGLRYPFDNKDSN